MGKVNDFYKKESIKTPKPSPLGWCSAQRIKTAMIASGNHTLIDRWQKSLIFDG